MRIVMIGALVGGLAIGAFADNNANSFAEGFAKGLQQSLYGTRQQPQEDYSYNYREARYWAYQQEQLEILREQYRVQQLQLQEQQNRGKWYNEPLDKDSK